jgi:hypothetical protein
MCASKPPDVPKPTPPPEPLKNLDEAQRSARDSVRRRAAAGGMGGTNQTGGLGVSSVPLLNQLGK